MGVTASSGGGDFWKPPNGMYVVELADSEDRPDQTGYGGKIVDQWRLTFKVLNLSDQTPYTGPDVEGNEQATDEGAEFVVDISQTLGLKSTARPWFSALRNKDVEDGENSEDIIPDCIGRRAMAQFANNEKGRPGKLKNLIPLPPAS